MINTVTLFGKIVSDTIELRQSKSGTPVTEFRIVHTNKRAKHALFIDIEVWGEQAVRASENLQKGDRVIAYGQLRPDIWEKDGQKRSKIKITADKVIISANTKTDEEPTAF